MAFTLAQIRAFERIARLGSFHAAARHVGITQSSISHRIRDLEEVLGTALFVRNGPRITLTADGHAFLAYADRLLETAEEAAVRFKKRNPLLGLLRLGVNESFAHICLTELMGRLEQQYPKLKTSVTVGDTGMTSMLLNDHQLDIAIISEPMVASHIHQVPIGRNELAWIASSKFKLPPGILTPSELSQHHVIVSPQTARIYATMTNWFTQSGSAPKRVSTCNSLSVTILMIKSGFGIGLVPSRIVADELARGQLVKLQVTAPVEPHQVSICYQVVEFGPDLEAIVNLTKELISQHQLFK